MDLQWIYLAYDNWGDHTYLRNEKEMDRASVSNNFVTINLLYDFDWFDSSRPINNLSVIKGRGIPGLNQY